MNFIYKFLFILIFTFAINMPSNAETKSPKSIYSSEADPKVIEIIKKLKGKKELIRTAKLESKVLYNLPFRRKLKLVQDISIEKESEIHIRIFAIWKIKIAEFFTKDGQIIYQRLGKKDKIRNIETFNLKIFNKHLDLPLTTLELNNFLLGMNIDTLDNNGYKYDLKNNKLIIFNKNNKCIVDLKTNEIEKILVDDHRKMEINYSRYTQIKEHKIKLPLYVELKTDTFTMQINIQNDIIINNKNLNEKKPL